MTDRLPPLSALRAFDAAARHLSFAKAAEELQVTPAALSQQIKNLETHLGAQVFLRLNRAVALTDIGRALAPGCREGFTHLGTAWRAALTQSRTKVLSVAAGPAFTARWLAPRLHEFDAARHGSELRLAASLQTRDFDRDGIDVAIHHGIEPPAGVHAEDLLPETYLPVLRPDLAVRYTEVESLREAPLLAEMPGKGAPSWQDWFATQDMDLNPECKTAPAGPMVEAALAGESVALVRSSLVLPLLSSGALVAPFGPALESPARYRFLCRVGEEDRPAVVAFRDWLFAVVGQFKEPDHARVPVNQLP